MKIEELKDSNIIHRLFLEDDIFYDIDVHLYILNILMDKNKLVIYFGKGWHHYWNKQYGFPTKS